MNTRVPPVTVRHPWPDELRRLEYGEAQARRFGEPYVWVMVADKPERVVGSCGLTLLRDGEGGSLTFDVRPRFYGEPTVTLIEMAVAQARSLDLPTVWVRQPEHSPLSASLITAGFAQRWIDEHWEAPASEVARRSLHLEAPSLRRLERIGHVELRPIEAEDLSDAARLMMDHQLYGDVEFQIDPEGKGHGLWPAASPVCRIDGQFAGAILGRRDGDAVHVQGRAVASRWMAYSHLINAVLGARLAAGLGEAVARIHYQARSGANEETRAWSKRAGGRLLHRSVSLSREIG